MNLLTATTSLRALPDALEMIRASGRDAFGQQGLPTRQSENWRYTSLKNLEAAEFIPALAAEATLSHEELRSLALDLDGDFHRAVFVNGQLDRTLSDTEDWPAELQWSTDPVAWAPAEIDTSAPETTDALDALSRAYLGQGLVLKVPGETALRKPFRVHFHSSLHGSRGLMTHPRLRVELGPRSSFTWIETYSGTDEAQHFTNVRAEVVLGESSRLVHVRLQEEGLKSTHLAQTRYRVAAHASLTSLSAAVGGALFRHELDLKITAGDVHAKVLGLTVSTGEQHMDHSTTIDHAVGGSRTEQLYKSLLDGRSRTVFNGRIFIRPGAQKASSEQLNNNLLLTSTAEADSQPQLEIEADDVKATHGSTVGHLDAEELFYLRSRGLPRAQALPLLAYAFVADVVDHLEDETVKSWLGRRLKKSFGRIQVVSP